MRETRDKKLRLLALILAFAVAFTTILPSGLTVKAADDSYGTAAAVATPGDADGLYRESDGYYYYYKSGEIVTGTGWVTVTKTLTVKLDSKHRVQFKVAKSGTRTYISQYDADQKKFAAYEKKSVVMADKKLHYAGVKGLIATKSGNVSDGKGTTYILGAGGIVTAKLVKSGEIRRYYTYSANKWQMKKNAYITVNGVSYYFNAKNGAATMMYNKGTSQLYKFRTSKMALVKSDISSIQGKLIYFFNSKGQKVTKAGWYNTASGTKVYVNSKGYVTTKMPASGKSRRYYVYSYSKKKWVAKTNTWIKVGGVDYYFASHGIAVYMYNTASGKFVSYKNGKWNLVKNATCKLRDGRIYLCGSKSVIVKKSGWYFVNSTDQVYVGSKGYVTMKFSTKSGKLTKYNYSKKKWEVVKVVSYKIGSKVYYFDSKGVMAKNRIVGNDKTGYFYVDETGCKSTSTEIQMAVDFVRQHTDDSMTNEEKLYACFVYLSRNYPYLRDYVVPTDASRFTYYCIDMLTNNHGNCYRCAATFATVATVLGYEARVTCGQVTNLQGDGFTIHGWTELWRPEDNEWVVYDVSMQRNWPARDYYHVLMKDYYPTHRIIGPRARLTVKNGKANWRWLADSELGDH